MAEVWMLTAEYECGHEDPIAVCSSLEKAVLAMLSSLSDGYQYAHDDNEFMYFFIVECALDDADILAISEAEGRYPWYARFGGNGEFVPERSHLDWRDYDDG